METTLEHENFENFLKNRASSEEFPVLWQFPREFRRNWFKQLDYRFIVILISTFIFEVCILLLLLSWVMGKERHIDPNSLQKQYAKLLLDKYTETDFSTDNAKLAETFLYGVPDELEQLTSSQEMPPGSEPNPAASSPGAYSKNTSSVASSQKEPGETYVGQTNFSKDRASYRRRSAETIASMGLLHYLSNQSDTKSTSKELRDMFAQSDRNIEYLEGSLANVNVNRLKEQGTYLETGSAPGRSSFTGIKGSKSGVTAKEVQASLTPLEKANISTVAKNTELEETSASRLNKTGKKANARKADQVTRVVLAHNRAIQDCYKHALKKNPELKGKIVVRFSVNPDGSVDQVEIIQATINYEPMLSCVVNRIRRWNDFGESDISLGTVSYRQTYVFGY